MPGRRSNYTTAVRNPAPTNRIDVHLTVLVSAETCKRLEQERIRKSKKFGDRLTMAHVIRAALNRYLTWVEEEAEEESQ